MSGRDITSYYWPVHGLLLLQDSFRQLRTFKQLGALFRALIENNAPVVHRVRIIYGQYVEIWNGGLIKSMSGDNLISAR